MRNLLLLFVFSFLSFGIMNAQSMEELKSMKTDKQASIDAIQAEIDGIQKQINEFPGWSTKLLGTLGGNFSGFSNWAANANTNSSAQSFVFDLFGSVRYNGDKHFLYNDAILSVGRLSTDNDTTDDEDGITSTLPNKLNLSSLYGYKLTSTLALSAGIAYNTGILGTNAVSGSKIFNNPGDLDIGIGATWTPINDFYLMVHPLNYHFKFGDNPDFASAAGAKIKAGYAREIIKGVAWVSNLEGFYAYGSAGINELTNNPRPSASWYEWTNTFAFSVWRGIGVGITYGLRTAKSEFADTQSRYSVGLSYTL